MEFYRNCRWFFQSLPYARILRGWGREVHQYIAPQECIPTTIYHSFHFTRNILWRVITLWKINSNCLTQYNLWTSILSSVDNRTMMLIFPCGTSHVNHTYFIINWFIKMLYMPWLGFCVTSSCPFMMLTLSRGNSSDLWIFQQYIFRLIICYGYASLQERVNYF